MSNNIKHFTLTKLAEKYTFVKDSELYKFYDALNNSCKEKEHHNTFEALWYLGIYDPSIISFIKNEVFKKLNCLLNNTEASVDNISSSKDRHCIYLKYWLYDKLIIEGFDKYDIRIIFDFLKKKKNAFMKILKSDRPCNIYKLSLSDIHKIKILYDYSEFLHDSDTTKYDLILKEEEYLTYFKKGLDLYQNSKIICPSIKKDDYCYEFNEYETKYKRKSAYLSCKEKLLSSLHKKVTTLNGGSLQGDRKPKGAVDLDLYELLKKDKIVDKIHLHKFYESLEQHKGTDTSDICNSLKSYPVKDENAVCELLKHAEYILNNWDKTYATYQELTTSETCDYMRYWLYDKLSRIDANPCEIETFYILWHNYTMDESKNKNKCKNEKYYGFNKEELENKKKLFDFLVYYKSIKDKIKEPKNARKNDYCHYIKYIFELYKNMEQKNISHSYTEELKLFQNNFSSNRELYFLEEICPDMCLGFVFNKKFKTLCPFEKKPIIEAQKKNLTPCQKIDHTITGRNLDGNHERDYNFSNFTTHDVYKELNGEIITNNYYSICDKFILFNEKHCGIHDLCSKLVRNLKKLSRMENKEREDRCTYIIHWIYDALRKIPNIISENNYETIALREFFNVGYEILRQLEISDCFFNTLNINFDEQKEKKYLHDYFKNYEKMQGKNFCNNDTCQQYCEYITFINMLYGKYINRCCYCFESDGCKEIYPSYFKCDDNYNPFKLFEKLQCNNFEEFRAKFKKVDTPIPEDHYVKRLAYISVNEPHLLNWGNKKSSIIPEVVSDKITSDPFQTFALGSFGFLGVLLILFILYKFTPMGSYFNNRDARNKESYFENFEQQFLEDEVQFKHGNTENRRMRIAYHQA
ncbi:PIR protein [Plasmodium ovale]|uniref:PIR protein n=1 Tax=Plasmodium ovale TaxID=36330 RepID=A0A1D3JGC3_PLAOA|nr:PIR protein [Plasmodium ovale]